MKGDEVKSKFAVLVGLALLGIAAFAAGAPWYKWINQAEGTIVCTQASPGDGWVEYQGPFSESRCRKPGNPQ